MRNFVPMIFPVADRDGRMDARALDLDVQVALGLDGFRWMRWLEGESPDAPRDSRGRFLARQGDPLAHLQEPAPLSLALAPQPYRHLPRYSLDARLALGVCERVGLFRCDGVTLKQESDGSWWLRAPWEGAPLCDASLPTLLARAALAWHRQLEHFRQAFP